MKKKIIITFSIIVSLLVFGAGGYAYYLYNSVKQTANRIYQPVSSVKPDKLHLKNDVVRPISILLMGVDERTNDVGRSDTLIVMTLNPKTKTMQMVSIPRDTRTKIVGYGNDYHKINSAYAYGGTKMEVATVEKFLNIKLDYYIRINMQGLSDLVDSVGGVTVYNDISWPGFPKGELTLDGKRALTFARMRHQDPRGDFGRNKRQRDVIKAVIDKMANVSSFSHYKDVLNAIGSNVKTNLSFDDMKYIAAHYKDARDHIVTYEVKGIGTMIHHIYFLLVSDQERKKVGQMINNQLQS